MLGFDFYNKDAYMIRRSVVEPLPFLATQKAKRAGLTASNLKIVRFAFQILSQISQIY